MKNEISQNQNYVTIVTDNPAPLPATAPQPATPDSTPGAAPSFDAQSLRRKLRASSFFHKLSDTQQRTLLEWLEEISDLAEIQKRIAAPPPDGFGLDVQYTTLKRLRSLDRSLQFTEANEEILDTIHDMETSSDFSQSTRIQKAIHQMLLQKAFEIAETEPDSPSLPRLLACIEKLSTLDLKREKLLLARRSHSSHSSPSISRHHVELTIAPASPAIRKIATVQIDPPAKQLPAPPATTKKPKPPARRRRVISAPKQKRPS